MSVRPTTSPSKPRSAAGLALRLGVALLLAGPTAPALAWGPSMTAGSDGNGAGPAPEPIAPRADRLGPQSAAELVDVGDGERINPMLLTRQALVDFGLRYVTEIALSVQQGQDLRRQAEIEKDLIKLSCIAEQLTQMREIKRRLDEHLVNMSLQSAKMDEVRFDFRQVAMGNRRVRSLRTQLAQCVGKDFENISVTEVMVEEPSTGFDGHDPNRPGVGGFGQMPTPIMERPPAASRYQ